MVQDEKSDVFDYVVSRYIDNPEHKNHGQLISEIYAHFRDYFCVFNKISVLASIHEQEKVREVLSSFGDRGDAVGISRIKKA